MTPQRATRGDVIAAVRRISHEQADATVFVGIDGFGGAGKSSLADAVAAAVDRAAVVRVDDFWGPSIAEWDWARFRDQLLHPLLAGRPARYQKWNWVDDAGGEWAEVQPGQVVVVEGVSATRVDAGVPWDLTVWVDAPRDVRLERALQRDGPALLGRWLDDWMPSEEAYARRENPRARVDLLVDGTG